MLKRLQRLVVVFQFSEVDGQILPSGRRAGRAPDLRVADMGRPPLGTPTTIVLGAAHLPGDGVQQRALHVHAIGCDL